MFYSMGVDFFLPLFISIVKYKMLLSLCFRIYGMNRHNWQTIGERIFFGRRNEACQDSLEIVAKM